MVTLPSSHPANAARGVAWRVLAHTLAVIAACTLATKFARLSDQLALLERSGDGTAVSVRIHVPTRPRYVPAQKCSMPCGHVTCDWSRCTVMHCLEPAPQDKTPHYTRRAAACAGMAPNAGTCCGSIQKAPCSDYACVRACEDPCTTTRHGEACVMTSMNSECTTRERGISEPHLEATSGNPWRATNARSPVQILISNQGMACKQSGDDNRCAQTLCLRWIGGNRLLASAHPLSLWCQLGTPSRRRHRHRHHRHYHHRGRRCHTLSVNQLCVTATSSLSLRLAPAHALLRCLRGGCLVRLRAPHDVHGA